MIYYLILSTFIFVLMLLVILFSTALKTKNGVAVILVSILACAFELLSISYLASSWALYLPVEEVVRLVTIMFWGRLLTSDEIRQILSLEGYKSLLSVITFKWMLLVTLLLILLAVPMNTPISVFSVASPVSDDELTLSELMSIVKKNSSSSLITVLPNGSFVAPVSSPEVPVMALSMFGESAPVYFNFPQETVSTVSHMSIDEVTVSSSSSVVPARSNFPLSITNSPAWNSLASPVAPALSLDTVSLPIKLYPVEFYRLASDSSISSMCYPSLMSAYSKGLVLVSPEPIAALSLTWPACPYEPSELEVNGLLLEDLLSMSLSLVEGVMDGRYFMVQEAFVAFEEIVSEATTYDESGALHLDNFVADMFVGIPLEDLIQMSRWVSSDTLVALSTVYPSLNPVYLQLGMTAQAAKDLLQSPDCMSYLLERGFTTASYEDLKNAPSELVPSPWSYSYDICDD